MLKVYNFFLFRPCQVKLMSYFLCTTRHVRDSTPLLSRHMIGLHRFTLRCLFGLLAPILLINFIRDRAVPCQVEIVLLHSRQACVPHIKVHVGRKKGYALHELSSSNKSKLSLLEISLEIKHILTMFAGTGCIN